MKKLSVLMVALLLAACSSNGGSTGTAVKEGSASIGEEANKTVASVKLEGDKIIELSIDQYQDGQSKMELGADYNMKGASEIKKEWNEQIEFLADYIKENGTDIAINEEGKPTDAEVLTGCTVGIENILAAVNEAVANAK